nr:unnamed protein product [Naegleria fowleri]
MSKRNRSSFMRVDPFFVDDDSSDEDYIPSDEEYQSSDHSEGKINPHLSKREYIQLPPHLTGVIREKDLNKIHFELLTSQNDLEEMEEMDEISWKKERSIFLTQQQHVIHDEGPVLERIFVSHISDFTDPTTTHSSSSSLNVKQENEETAPKNQVRLGILCRNNSKVDVILKFFIDGKELKEMETVVQKGEVVNLHGYDDLRKKMRQRLLLNKYVHNPERTQNVTNQASSSTQTENGYGVIKIEVYKATSIRKYHDDSDEEEEEKECDKEKEIDKSSSNSTPLQTLSNTAQKRCGMQVTIQSSKIQPHKKTSKRGKQSQTETIFFKENLLFQSLYKYRNYLGFLVELNDYNIDLKKLSNTAQRRTLKEEDHSSDYSDEEDHDGIATNSAPTIVKKEEDLIVDLTEEEPPKAIETISLESDSEENVMTPKMTTQNSIAECTYIFTETTQDVTRKTVDELRTFIKLNDEELYNNIRNILSEKEISGSRFMSLSSADFYQMKLDMKDQIKILQITNRIHQNSSCLNSD